MVRLSRTARPAPAFIGGDHHVVLAAALVVYYHQAQALRRNVRLPQHEILGERVVFAIAGPEPQHIERRQPSPRRWPQQQIDRAVDMTEQGAAAIAALLRRSRSASAPRWGCRKRLQRKLSPLRSVACQFVTPFGSDAVSTIVQEDAVASEGIARQGRAAVNASKSAPMATTPEILGDDQDYHTRGQEHLQLATPLLPS